MNSCFFIPTEYSYKDNGFDTAVKKSVAIIIQSLLFEGNVIFNDAICINIPHLRSTFEHPLIRQLILDQKINFAVRCKNDVYIPLIETAKDILSKGKINLNYTHKKEFKVSNVLQFIDKHGMKIPYSVEGARSFYTNGILDSFTKKDYVKYIPENVQNLIIKIVREKINKDGYLDSVFFQRGFGIAARLDKQLNKTSSWKEYGGFLSKLSEANYYMFLPNLLDIAPVYGTYHKEAFNIWRNMPNGPTQCIDKTTLTSYYNPSNFVAALLSLTIKDIYMLIDSNECKEYKKAKLDLRSSSSSVYNLKVCYERYKQMIDLTICKNVGMINKTQYKTKLFFHRYEPIIRSFGQVLEYLILENCNTSVSFFKMGLDAINTVTKPGKGVEQNIKQSMDINKIKTILSESGHYPHEVIQQNISPKSLLSDIMINDQTLF